MIKQCLKPNCGQRYRVCDEGFGLNNCRVCGAPLKVIKESQDNIDENENINDSIENELSETMITNSLSEELNNIEELDETIQPNVSKVDYNTMYIPREEDKETFEIDDFGYIYFNSINEKNIKAPKIIVYLDKIIYSVITLKYDDMTIGRGTNDIKPDIDFKNIDINKIVSRKHAVLYKRSNDYYIKAIAMQNSVQVNGEELVKNRDRRLLNGDIIMLSKKFLMKYIS